MRTLVRVVRLVLLAVLLRAAWVLCWLATKADPDRQLESHYYLWRPPRRRPFRE